MRLLYYDEAAKIQFLGLQKSRIRIGTMDLKIATVAISQNARLLSRDLKDFQKVLALMVEDWTIAVS
jgi:tRNA(fMet)-specific endonuclease VapC